MIEKMIVTSLALLLQVLDRFYKQSSQISCFIFLKIKREG